MCIVAISKKGILSGKATFSVCFVVGYERYGPCTSYWSDYTQLDCGCNFNNVLICGGSIPLCGDLHVRMCLSRLRVWTEDPLRPLWWKMIVSGQMRYYLSIRFG